MTATETFRPRITAVKDPSDPKRQLWQWHFPKGDPEFHGVVKFTPIPLAKKEYANALMDRFKIAILPGAVECVEFAEAPPAPAAAPLPEAKPKPIAPAKPIEPAERLTDVVARLIPAVKNLNDGEPLTVQTPKGLSMMSLRSMLGIALRKRYPDSIWTTSSIRENDPEYAHKDRCFYLTRRDIAVPAPGVVTQMLNDPLLIRDPAPAPARPPVEVVDGIPQYFKSPDPEEESAGAPDLQPDDDPVRAVMRGKTKKVFHLPGEPGQPESCAIPTPPEVQPERPVSLSDDPPDIVAQAIAARKNAEELRVVAIEHLLARQQQINVHLRSLGYDPKVGA